jgi:hypothetical protein
VLFKLNKELGPSDITNHTYEREVENTPSFVLKCPWPKNVLHKFSWKSVNMRTQTQTAYLVSNIQKIPATYTCICKIFFITLTMPSLQCSYSAELQEDNWIIHSKWWVRKWLWPNLRYYPGIWLEKLRKSMNTSVITGGPNFLTVRSRIIQISLKMDWVIQKHGEMQTI